LKRGDVEFYFGYAWPVYDCEDCGCRFTRHDETAYDLFYSEKSSCYSRYAEQSESCKVLFDRGELGKLREALSQSSKYRFVIDAIDGEKANARILEIGSSRGQLTSYFILAGRTITGVDVSPKAVAAARGAFGEYFAKADDPLIDAQAPYDVVFHVGTIGCVADPVGMIRHGLSLLKPGGRLLFNAPNRDGLSWRNQLWFDSAPPPDVVTLFRPGFWRRYFSDVASVLEQIEGCSSEQNLIVALRKLAGRKWRQPLTLALKDSEILPTRAPAFGDALWCNFERVMRKSAQLTGFHRLAPPHPSEYGLFVQMVKK
jgi:SAM-dependent methyltransferase